MTTDPKWLTLALADVGQQETEGPNRSPWIRGMWARQGLSWLLGQPWCGGAAAHWMRSCDIAPPTNAFRAKSWATWGQPCGRVRGAVLVFEREGGGHVGFLSHVLPDGRLVVVGANQKDMVCSLPFIPARLVACRWPADRLAPSTLAPVIAGTWGASSTNEA